MANDLPKRKQNRLQNFDYCTPGAYFITICTKDRKKYLWCGNIDMQTFQWNSVGANCVRPKNLPLSDVGKIVSDELEIWNHQYESVYLQSYVIMPNHLHVMVVVLPNEGGRTQFAPTVSRMVKQFKGAITKKLGYSIWQKSFIDHIVRDRYDYEIKTKYIYENPMHWYYDELYSDN